jgi:hypothetical protein
MPKPSKGNWVRGEAWSEVGRKWVKSGKRWLKKGKSGVKWGIKRAVKLVANLGKGASKKCF